MMRAQFFFKALFVFTAAAVSAVLTRNFLGSQTDQRLCIVLLGLTVVTTIAEQHGGTLNFEHTKNGIKAIMKISRH